MTASSAAQYCGHCLARFNADESRCPECHAIARGLGYRQAQQVLLGALTGAGIGERRVHLIRLIGDRADAGAAPALLEFVLDCGSDQVEGLAVVECLDRMLVGPARLDALRRLNQQHPDDIVRLAAAQALTRYL
jgi:hypothetical protein